MREERNDTHADTSTPADGLAAGRQGCGRKKRRGHGVRPELPGGSGEYRRETKDGYAQARDRPIRARHGRRGTMRSGT